MQIYDMMIYDTVCFSGYLCFNNHGLFNNYSLTEDKSMRYQQCNNFEKQFGCKFKAA